MVVRKVPRFAREEGPRARAPDGSARAEAHGRYHSAAKALRRAEVARWLVREYRFSPDQAEAVVRRLLEAAPEIRGAFLRWWATGKLEDVRVAGHGLEDLVRERGMHPVGAMLALSLLRLEPEAATREIRRIEGDAVPGGTDPRQIERLVASTSRREAG